MQAINCKNIDDIKMFLEEVSADMSIIIYNIKEEIHCSEEKKEKYLKMIKELEDNIDKMVSQLD